MLTIPKDGGVRMIATKNNLKLRTPRFSQQNMAKI
jgi:hypothetical protein